MRARVGGDGQYPVVEETYKAFARHRGEDWTCQPYLMQMVRSGQIRTGGATPSPRMPQRNPMMRGNDMRRPTPEMIQQLRQKQVGMAPPGGGRVMPGGPGGMPGGRQMLPLQPQGPLAGLRGRMGPGAGTRPGSGRMPLQRAPGTPQTGFGGRFGGFGGLRQAISAARRPQAPVQGVSRGRTGITPGNRVNPLVGRPAGPDGGAYSPIRRGSRMAFPMR